jgi:hypothetical protein
VRRGNFSVVSDGEGGPALRLTIPAGVGGGGVLASAFRVGANAHGRNGEEQWGRTGLRLAPGYQPSGAYNWLVEWHEQMNPYTGIDSNALGVNGNRQLFIQLSGGDVSGHQYTHHTDSQSLEVGRWYQLVWHAKWSPDPNVGLFELWLDGRLVGSWRRGTLLRSGGNVDELAFGLYNYHPPVGVPVSVDFRRTALGPTRQSIGA